MRLRHMIGALCKGLRPVGALEARAAREFAHKHNLSSGLGAQLVGFRRAREYGLHLLPAGLGLDGRIFDIGAHRGDFAALIRQLEPRSELICVEPVPANVAHLSRRFASDGNVQVRGLAVSDQIGTRTLNVARATRLASLLAPAEGLSAYGAHAQIVEYATVDTTTLDALTGEDEIRLLKVDVQGHEAALLRGAASTLRRTAAVLIEVLFVSHYEGDATFGAIDDQMRSAGFELVGLEPAPNDNRLMWGDACYVKRPTYARRRPRDDPPARGARARR